MRILLAVVAALWVAPAMAEVALEGPNGTRFRIDDMGAGGMVGPPAFADWPQLCVRVGDLAGGDCLAGDVYDAGGVGATPELNGRQLALATDSLAGLDVQRRVFVPNAGNNLADGFVRYLDRLTNNTGAPITVSVRIGTVAANTGRLGVDGLTIWRTSSDDAVATPADRWLVVDDGNAGGGAAAVGALMHGAGARSAPTALGQGFPTADDDQALAWQFADVRVEPGQTRFFLTVVVHEAGRAAAIDEVDNLLRVREADVLFGLTNPQRSAVYNFDVTPGNGAALADAGGPYNADEGEQIQLSAAGSFDPEGLPLIYEWDFDGDGQYDDARGINAFHTVPDDGVVEVGLQVTDAAGKVDRDTARIVVLNVAPQIDGVNTDSPIDEGSTLNVDVQVTDPGDDPLTFDFDWDGDGVYDETGIDSNRYAHRFVGDGVFTARVRVQDGDGGVTERDFPISVQNVPPRVFNVAVPPLVAEGSDFEVLVAAQDPGGDPMTFRYDLDEDGIDDVVEVGLDRLTTRFPDDGLFTVTVTVCDDQDACSEPRAQAVNIGNVDPTIVSVVSNGPVPEGSPVTVTIEATDPGGAGDPLLYSFDWDNDGEFIDDVPDGPNASEQYIFPQQGRYFVGVQVRDDDNGVAVGNVEITVQNVAPTAELSGPAAGAEGAELPFECQGVDPGADDLSYDWDLDGDGAFELLGGEAIERARFGQEGNYVVRCRVSDGDGGVATDSAEVVINNVRPTLELEADSPQDEGAEVVVRAVAVDPGDDSLVYTFDFDGDGMPEIVDAEGNGAEIGRHVYPDQGLYTVQVDVFDGTDSIDAQLVMEIRNVAPTVRLTTNSPVDEGGQLRLTAEVLDPGADTVSLEWDIDGDRVPDIEGQADGGEIEQLVRPADDARFDVTLVALDEDGGRSEATAAVIVRNVDPSFPDEFRLPPAQEGEDYPGTVPAEDPAGINDPLAFSLLNPPAQIDIDRNTGQLLWNPSYDDYLNQPLTITVRVTDGDGGSAETDIELTVLARDEDGDLLPDSYEELTCDPDVPDRCLDPTDPTDAREDPDGDGRDNLTEWQEETDPFFYEGPETPLLQAPLDGGRIATLTPALVVSWVDNPIGGRVAIEYGIYADAALESEVTVSEPIDQAEDEGEPTGWEPPEGLLFEDQWYWWRARSVAGEARSAWSEAFSFRTNASNSAPTAPILIQPADGATVDTATPTFRAMPSTDIDEDMVRYIFNIDAPGANGTGQVTPDGVVFTPNVALPENAVITWQVTAVDGAGGETRSEEWSLRVDSENVAPTPPRFVVPEPPMGNVVPVLAELQPLLIVGGSVDEDGDAVSYIIGIREVSDGEMGAIITQSEPLPATVEGEASWRVDVELEENVDYFVFASAVDERGTESAPVTQQVFVSAIDEAPPAPELSSPNNGATVPLSGAVMLWTAVADPERLRPVVYFVEYCDSDDICTEARTEGLSYNLTELAQPGEQYTWSVRAEDPAGNRSRPSNPRTFAINQTAEPVSGCGCDTVDGRPAPWTLALIGLGLLGLRRRRR